MNAIENTLRTECPVSQPPNTGQRSKGGPPKGSTNAKTHCLTIAVWPDGCEHDKRLVRTFMGSLRVAVVEAGGQLDIPTVATIQTCGRWERHARLAAKWLRNEHDKLTPDQRLSFSRDIARASAERDKCLRELKLDAKHVDPWATLDAQYKAALQSPHDAPGSDERASD